MAVNPRGLVVIWHVNRTREFLLGLGPTWHDDFESTHQMTFARSIAEGAHGRGWGGGLAVWMDGGGGGGASRGVLTAVCPDASPPLQVTLSQP